MSTTPTPSGNYRGLRTFQAATLIYDATYWFGERFLVAQPRLGEQMTHAARSSRLNIAKANHTAGSSARIEMRQVNSARASLEELRLDYEDFLRQRRLPQWLGESPEALSVRKVAGEPPKNPAAPDTDSAEASRPANERRYALYAKWLDHEDPAIRANAMLCLIGQANYLLDSQIAALEAQTGDSSCGDDEMPPATSPAAYAQPRNPPPPSAAANRATPAPACPKCGKAMLRRTAHKGNQPGKQFWGCSAYPDCKGLVSA